jgi:NTE family protein
MKTLALALGGGGARGLAHVIVLEALDEMGITPVAIAGTSIGALMGASYAAGMSGAEIRDHVVTVTRKRSDLLRRLVGTRATKLRSLLSAGFRSATLVDAQKFCANFLPHAVPADFADLAIPLTVIASDIYRRREVAFTSGPLKRALAASIAIPGLTQPIVIDKHILVDGGATNPLPFDHLYGRADIILAVDISGPPAEDRSDLPNAWECLYASVLVMEHTIVSEKLRHGAPHILIQPKVGTYRALDFFRADSILRASEPVKNEIMTKLGKLL